MSKFNLELKDLVKAIGIHIPNITKTSQLKPIQTGLFNTSYYVDNNTVVRVAPHSDSAFVFYEREMMKQEPGIHELVRAKTSVPVAQIIASDFTRKTIDRDFMLMERVPGQPAGQQPHANWEKILFQVGKHLGEVHSLTAESNMYGYIGEHRPMEPQPTWVDAFEVMWGKLIDDVVREGYYGDKEKDALLQLFQEHRALFDRKVQPHLLHMDIWHENILVDEKSHVTGILDWDRALWGDPEIEFAILDYCSISKPAFWKGYGKARDESPEAMTRQAFYFLYELQKYIVIEGARDGKKSQAHKFKKQVGDFVFKQFRKVL